MGQPITIQNLSDAAIRRLQELADHRGEDVSTLAGRMLELDLTTPAKHPVAAAEASNGQHRDLDHLAGGWTEADAREFNQAIEPLTHVDPELWK